MASLARVLLALCTCPLLGAMLGRATLTALMGSASWDSLGWWAGLAVGLAYAVAVLRLSMRGPRRTDRVVGDIVLLALAGMAAADFVAQLSRTEVGRLLPVTGVMYVFGLLVVLRRLRRAAL